MTVAALSDFSGYNSVFCLDSSEYFAVGNRASFVGAFRTGYPGRNEMDADVLSWLVGDYHDHGHQDAVLGCIAFADRVPHRL